MPSSSKKQHNFMAAVAHNKGFAKKVRVPQSVGKDFTEADKSKKMKKYSGKDGSDVKSEKPKESLADKNSKMLSQMLKKHVKEHPEPYPTEAEADILKEQEDKKMDEQTNKGYENYKKRRQSGEMSEYKKGGSVKSRVDGCAQRGKTRGKSR